MDTFPIQLSVSAIGSSLLQTRYNRAYVLAESNFQYPPSDRRCFKPEYAGEVDTVGVLSVSAIGSSLLQTKKYIDIPGGNMSFSIRHRIVVASNVSPPGLP